MESDREPKRKTVKRKKGSKGKRTALIVAGVIVAFGAGRALLAWRHPASGSPSVAPPGIAPLLPSTPPGIVLHHSYTPGKMGGRLVDAAKLEEMDVATHPEWNVTYQGKKYHIGYHYVIMTDGTVQQGRPDLCPGAHARTFNNWLGICLIGTFATHTAHHWQPDHPTPAQMASLISLCESLMAKYHIPPEMVKRHRDVNVTWCPGDNFPYAQLIEKLTDYTRAHPEMYPTPPVILKIVKPPPLKK